VMGLEIGADDYLTSRSARASCGAGLKALAASRGDPESDGPIQFDGLEVDFARGELRRDGESIELSDRVQAVSIFVRRGGGLSRSN